MDTNTYDVIVLGTGIAGTMIAAIMARHGFSVVMIDKQSHPRFAIGESTVGHTSAMVQLIADRYDVPEIGYLASFSSVRKHVGSSHGVKRAISFIFHRKDGTQKADEVNQFVIPPHLHGLENHLYRQDTDAFMFQVAVGYGAQFILDVSVKDIEVDDYGVTVVTDKTSVKGQFVVDGTGFRSVLADKFQLRPEKTELQTNSRSLFNHMYFVKPYDDCIEKDKHNAPIPWFQSTVHHIFEGGWIWVIPFNNTKSATNPLCSVGVTLDLDHFPRTNKRPEEEFEDIISRFPSIKAQFKYARPVRNWISTGRLQYSAKTTVGDRFVLLAHAAGFVDPLYSRGLAITMDNIFHLSNRIMNALRTRNFDKAQFQFVDEIVLGGVNYHDKLVATSYRSWKDYRLWNAWLRIWALGEAGLDQLRLIKAHQAFLSSGDEKHLLSLEKITDPGCLCPDSPEFSKLFEDSMEQVNLAADNKISIDEACANIYRLIEESELISPKLGVHNPMVKHFGHNQLGNMKSFIWGKTKSKPHTRKYYDIPLSHINKLFLSNFGEFFNSEFKLDKQINKSIRIQDSLVEPVKGEILAIKSVQE